jgi:GntR family transcriptional repressor for pyruvate dehydrogenase complex
MFKPIKHKRVYEEILEQIKQMVTEGSLKPGDRLTSERELAEQLQVSRASIREAFSALDMMGILESKPGEGTFIREVSEDSLIKPLSLMLMLYQDNTMDVVEIRDILEAGSASLAAVRATPQDLTIIRDHLNAMALDSREGVTGEVSDIHFHLAVADAAGNKVLARLMNTISDLMLETMRYVRQRMFVTPGSKEKLLAQHEAIYNAIAANDPVRAGEAMRSHLQFVREEIISHEKNDLRQKEVAP